MALVTYIIGACPGCGAPDSYGNVTVSRDSLHRGCLKCRYWERIPLPTLHKKVVYLDQFFYSHAFRGNNPAFVAAKRRLEQLAHRQLVVAPYCGLHEDETHLWDPEQSGPLWSFIKQSSAGCDFHDEYQVKMAQMHRAFEAFLQRAQPVDRIERDDCIPPDVNRWNDYVWIDVGRKPLTDRQTLQGAKARSLDQLLDVFPKWAATPSTFEADVREELAAEGQRYLRSYADYVRRMVEGDRAAFFDSPQDSQVVEELMQYGAQHLTPSLRMQRIQAFFASEYFAAVPVERISSEFFALLRKRLRGGAYRAREKAAKHFKGFFFDVRFISTYAPYCDAMVIDSLMHRWAIDPEIDLPNRYGTKFFSRANWSAFGDYLSEIERDETPDLRSALDMVYPKNAKTPDWSRLLPSGKR